MLLNITFNNLNLIIKKNITIIQLSELLNQSIPKFCYHGKLNIAGNCRMCLIELHNSFKPIIACATTLINNMNINTDTPFVKKARENILEFLLINHPLDCPICDQASECDLQDQTINFSSDRNRFYEYKRSLINKKMNPIISTIMNRCIHCTRCIRFISEIAYTKNLILLGRGYLTEIGFYIKNIYLNNLSGNIVDLCPVGALVSTPYNSIARKADLKSYNTIDIFDITTPYIRLDLKNSQIFRILPRLNFNNNWITDKTRFSFDVFINQRILYPFIKNTKVSWVILFNYIKNIVNLYKGNQLLMVCGSFIDIETLFIAKKLINSLGSANLYSLDKNCLINKNLNNKKINFNNNNNNFCIFFNLNLNKNLTIINIKLKKKILLGFLSIIYIGSKIMLNYPYYFLGLSFKNILLFLKGKRYICKYLNKKKYINLFFTNSYILQKNIIYFNKLKKYLNLNLNFIPEFISQLNMKEINFIPGNFSQIYKKKFLNNIKIIYLLGINSKIFSKNSYLYIYQGHNYTTIAQKAHIILPSSFSFEKKTKYLNIFNNLVNTTQILNKDINIKDDWKILFFLLNFLIKSKISIITFLYNLKKYLPYDHKLNFSFFYFNINVKIFKITKFSFFQENIDSYYINDNLFSLSKILIRLEQNYINSKKNFITNA